MKDHRVLVGLGVLVAGAFCLYLVLPIGCDIPKLEIRVSQSGGNTVFDFSVKRFYLLKGVVNENRYNLFEFSVWQIDEYKRRLKLMWKIKALPGADIHPKTVIYGKTPAGYEEVSPALPLQYDCLYELTDGNVLLNAKGNAQILPKHGHLPYLIHKVE